MLARLPRLATNSVNQHEISFFSKLSAQWWDEHGEFAFLHAMNPVRVRFIREKLLDAARDDHINPEPDPHTVLRGLDVLDVGCGGGLLSESLARLGAKTLGIDASASNIGIATQHASTDPRLSPASPASTLSYKHTTAEALLEGQKRYDVVCSMEVLEHVDNPTGFLSTCAELVKPGGHLFLSTVSRTPLSYFLTIFMAENVLRKVSRGTHTYSKYVRPSELIHFFESYRSPLSSPNPQSDVNPNSLSRPWISTSTSSYLPRTQADIRGLIYNPIFNNWILASRDAWGTTNCNYIFWVRKPKETDS